VHQGCFYEIFQLRLTPVMRVENQSFAMGSCGRSDRKAGVCFIFVVSDALFHLQVFFDCHKYHNMLAINGKLKDLLRLVLNGTRRRKPAIKLLICTEIQ
jgi:hypothetical protein